MEQTMKNRIEIVEDNDVVRDGLELLLNSMSDHRVVGSYDNCEKAIKNLNTDQPEVIFNGSGFARHEWY
jgi:DNA-binding NarL/FixJ family response regulator